MPPPSSKNIKKSFEKREKNIISMAYHQGKVFRKSKEKEKFTKLVNPVSPGLFGPCILPGWEKIAAPLAINPV